MIAFFREKFCNMIENREKIWDEWLISEIKFADYEASGILMGMRNFTTNRLKAARRLMKIWSSTSYAQNFNPGISMITRKNYKPSVRFNLPDKILKFPKGIKTSWAWLKGIFGSSGGLYFPKNGYYLALIISNKNILDFTKTILESTKLSWASRKNEFTLRNHEDIMTFLCNIDLTLNALEFDNTVMIRSVKNRANLQSNYEIANITRSSKAAGEQLKLCEKIIKAGILETLPDKLKSIVELRIKYPEYSLDELGQNLFPSISKSAVKYRWRKLQKIMEDNL